MQESKIAWTDHTYNPWIGCSRVSEGCRNCYAETQNGFYKWNGGEWGPGALRKLTSSDYWKQPLKWDRDAAKAGKRHRIFCASLADIFDLEAPVGARERLWELILKTPNLDWLILTKRPENFDLMLPANWALYHNVWLGVSVENRKSGYPRVDILRRTPAVVRFLSCEPLLEDVSDIDLRGIDWVICGGESGRHSREFRLEWGRALQARCAQEGKTFFMKQLGAEPTELSVPLIQIKKVTSQDGKREIKMKDWHGTDVSKFPADLQLQEWPR
jgi:protein gp37